MPPKRHGRTASNASTRSARQPAAIPVLDSSLAAESSIALASDTAPTSILSPPEVKAATASASAQSLSIQVPSAASSLLKFVAVAISCVVAQAVLNGTAMLLPLMGPVAEVSPYLGDSPWAVASLLGWKVLEIGVGWFGGFRATDMALFTLLTNFPQSYFLHTFYALPLLPLAINLLYNAFANYLGFYLNIPTSPKPQPPSQTTGTDATTFLTTRLLTTLIYSIPLLASYTTWPPLHLATHFDGLRTLAPAHSATLPSLALTFLALGDAAVRLLLNPIQDRDATLLAEESSTDAAKQALAFDPATASLGAHVSFNLHNLLFWRQLRPAGRLLVKRTALVAGWTVLNAAWNACATVEGCDVQGGAWAAGPLGWAGVWGAGALASGWMLGWVGGVL